MSITVYSVLMSVLCSDIFILILFLLRRSKVFTRYYGIAIIVFLYIFSIVRILIPVEFSFSEVIRSPVFYNSLSTFFNMKVINSEINVLQVLIVVWWVIAIFLILRYFYSYYLIHNKVFQYKEIQSNNIKSELDYVNKIYHKKIKVKFRQSKNISIPMGFGILHKTIILPEEAYEEKELHYIIAHECNHFYNYDLSLKILTQLFCCIFWWNPIVYLLKIELEDTLELKCDLTVSYILSPMERVEYMNTIVSGLKRSNQKLRSKRETNYSVAFFKEKRKQIIKKRLELISRSDIYNKKGYGIISLLLVCYILIYIFSYRYIIQPSFSAPAEVDGIQTVGSDQIEIIKTKEGLYYLHVCGTDMSVQIPEEEVKTHLMGGANLIVEEKE